MEAPMPILFAAAEFLSAQLDKLGGSWKFPFAGVAIDQARQYNYDKDLAQIWVGCDTAASEMAIYPLWQEFVIASAVSQVGCDRLLRSQLAEIRNLDAEAFTEISEYFDQVLLHGNSAKAMKHTLSHLETVDELLRKHRGERQRSLIQAILSIHPRSRDDVDILRQTLIRYLPSGECAAEISELHHLHRLVQATVSPPSGILQKYFWLGCRYPEQLQEWFEQLRCVVGALTSSTALYQKCDDLVLELRSLYEKCYSSNAKFGRYSWWNSFFDRGEMSLSDIAAFCLAIESGIVKQHTTRTWTELRSSWLQSVMDLIQKDESGQLLIFAARMAQLDRELSVSTDTVWPTDFDVGSLRSCLLRFESAAFNSRLFRNTWSVQRLAFQFSVSNTTSLRDLCLALLDLERHIQTQGLASDWPRRQALWEFPLSVLGSLSDSRSAFATIRDSFLKMVNSIPIQFVSKDGFNSTRLIWKQQVASCRYLYPLCELLLDFETGLEFEATTPSWADYRSEWGLHVHSSYTVSTFAHCLLDLERHLAASRLRNATVWRQRLFRLTLDDEPGRVGVLKRAVADMVKSIDKVHWRSDFRRCVDASNSTEQSLFMLLATCRTTEQVGVLVVFLVEMLMLPDEKTLSPEWFRTIDDCHTSFCLSACLLAFDALLSNSLRSAKSKSWKAWLVEVRTRTVSNVAGRALRNVLLLLEKHLEPSFMKTSWQIDSAIWRKLCLWQTTAEGIQLAMDVLLSNAVKFSFVFDSQSKSASERLLLLEETLPPTAVNSNWNRIRGLCRINLRRDTPTPMAIGVCLEHLAQNIIEYDRCISRKMGDIPHTIDEMKERLVALQRSISFASLELTWSEHQAHWQKAVESAKSPEDLAMPMLSFAAYIESLSADDPCKLSNDFHQLKEIWEHTLLKAIQNRIPSFLIQDDASTPPLSASDLELSRKWLIDMYYDRILSSGLYRILDVEHANISSARSFADLGMGIGLSVLQVFCDSSTSTRKCIGIEASYSRFRKAVQTTIEALECEILIQTSDEVVVSSKDQRMLCLRHGNLFECEDGLWSDVVLLFVRLNPAMHRRLCKFVRRMRPGSRLITPFHIPILFETLSLGMAPFRQIPINRLEADRFLLQSSPSTGQHLYVFVRI